MSDDDDDDDALETLTGYTYTHYDCNECEEAFEVEGDPKCEEIECPVCGKKYIAE